MHRFRRPLGLLVLTALGACAGPGFSPDDEAAVRAVEEAYRAGWLANDSAAVMATLAPDAVLMPAGLEPLTSDAAIRSFWWPDDGSTTTITAYEITIAEVMGSGDLAVLRGRGDLEFTYTTPDGETSTHESQAVHMAVFERGPDGRWRMSRRQWSALR